MVFNLTPSRIAGYILAGLCLTLAAPAQPTDLTSLADRLKRLESQMDALSRENRELRRQLGHEAKGQPPGVGVVAQGKEATLTIGGYVQANAEFGDAPDARFPTTDRIYLRRARLGLKGTFAEAFNFTLQSDFGNNAIGGVNGYRAQITDCFVNWNRYPAATVTLGQFKTPFGFEQLLADTKTLTVERSLPNDKLTLSRQIGAMVGGVLSPRVTYAAGLFNGNGVNMGANDNNQFLYVGRLTGAVVRSARGNLGVGIDAFAARDTGAFTGRRHGLGLDLQAGSGPLELQAEYLNLHLTPDTGTASNAHGWSVLGACMIVPKTLQGLVRYETYDPDTAAVGSQSSLWTVGLNYFIKGDDLKLSVNYLIGDPAGPLSNQGRLLTRFQIVY